MTVGLIGAITKLALGCEVSVKPISETRSLATRPRLSKEKELAIFCHRVALLAGRSQSRKPYGRGRVFGRCAAGPSHSRHFAVMQQFGRDRWKAGWQVERPGKFPSMSQAGVYSAVTHYLKTVDALKSDADGKAVVAKMKELPTDDPLFGKGYIRADGRKIHPAYVFEVKKPEESKYPGDNYKLRATIPADEAFRPLKEGGCPRVVHRAVLVLSPHVRVRSKERAPSSSDELDHDIRQVLHRRHNDVGLVRCLAERLSAPIDERRPHTGRFRAVKLGRIMPSLLRAQHSHAQRENAGGADATLSQAAKISQASGEGRG
jgi:hypothetical protein